MVLIKLQLTGLEAQLKLVEELVCLLVLGVQVVYFLVDVADLRSEFLRFLFGSQD